MSVELKINLNPIFHFNHINADEKTSSRRRNSKSINKLTRIKHHLPDSKKRPITINIIKNTNSHEYTDSRDQRSKQHAHKSIWFDIY